MNGDSSQLKLAPHQVGATPRATTRTRRSRSLSRRRVRAFIGVGQRWTDRYGNRWHIRQVHRKDEQVELHGIVSFAELGRRYTPEERHQ